MTDAILALVIFGSAIVLLCTEIIPIAVTAILTIVMLALTGVLTPAEAFRGFSDPIVLLLAGTFVIGGAIFHTGLVKRVGAVIARAGKREVYLTVSIMVVTAGLSALLSNTGTTAVLLPVVLPIAMNRDVWDARQLMALAFAANLGGTLTLIGTTPNLLAKGALDAAHLASFSFFEFAKLGLPLIVIGILYVVTLGRRLLPSQKESRIVPCFSKVLAFSKVDDPLTSLATTRKDKMKMWAAGLILLSVMTVMAGRWVALPVAALAGAVVAVIVGCVNYEQALRSINWTTIFLVAGMLALAAALEKTGVAMEIANGALQLIGHSANPYLLVSVFFLLTWTLTQFMANTASCALLIPVGLRVAQSLGVNPKSILMTIVIAASCAFATPVATPPNTLIYSTGYIRFTDFLKLGLPLSLLTLAASVLLIPVLWPFR